MSTITQQLLFEVSDWRNPPPPNPVAEHLTPSAYTTPLSVLLSAEVAYIALLPAASIEAVVATIALVAFAMIKDCFDPDVGQSHRDHLVNWVLDSLIAHAWVGNAVIYNPFERNLPITGPELRSFMDTRLDGLF